ncbi:MAG: PfkB family carbohydrate kinase [Thermoguttaceae bacterium]|nr:PfkB family carbohydrate kinase [Thermoguttaceae bacterium]
MSLAIIGSAAYDTIETPVDRRERVPGGSGFYSAVAASFFTDVFLTSVVGEDWQDRESNFLLSKHVNLDGLEIRSGAKTLYWSGRYFNNMNNRETREIQLNVMGQEYHPIVKDSSKDIPFLFLANGGPGIHLEYVRQFSRPKLVVADTMDYYIANDHDRLMQLLTQIDGLIINDSEAQLLTGNDQFYPAARKVLEMGPKFVIVKKGEHGAVYVSQDDIYLIPAFPTDNVVDPTGAGDSFAGGFMGCLAAAGSVTPENIKKALVCGTIIASFCVEGFSLERFQEIDTQAVESRLQAFRKMTAF